MSKRSRGQKMLSAMKKVRRDPEASVGAALASQSISETILETATNPPAEKVHSPTSSTTKNTTEGEQPLEETKQDSQETIAPTSSSHMKPPSILEEQCLKLVNKFKFLEVALNNMGRKKAVVWSQVSTYVEQMSASTFHMHDLALILTVWPKCVSLHWRVLAVDSLSEPEMSLCMAFPPLTSLLKGEEEDHQDSPRGEGRLDIFKMKMKAFREIKEEQKQEQYEFEAAPGVIPDKASLGTMSAQAGTGTRAGTGNVPAWVRAKATSATLGLQTRGIIDRESSSNTIAQNIFDSTLNVDARAKILSMEDLRELARSREHAAQIKSVNLANEKKKAGAESRLKAILGLCDSLRSLSKAKKHQSCAVLIDDIIRELCSSVDVTRSNKATTSESGSYGDKAEIMTRLKIISREVPEFLTITAPDDVISDYTLTVQLKANYPEVRQKILKFVSSALLRLDAKYPTTRTV